MDNKTPRTEEETKGTSIQEIEEIEQAITQLDETITELERLEKMYYEDTPAD